MPDEPVPPTPGVERLPSIVPEDVPADVVAAGQGHPMRQVTYAAAAEVGAWTPDLAGQVTAAFDGLAGEWHTRHSPGRLEAVADAVDRGAPPDHGLWLELGAGDGFASATLAARAPALVAVELSAAMLAASPDDGVPRLRADASALPLDDHAVTCAILVNMLLFPTELDRVLAPGGTLVWVSSRGPATPIHLTSAQVVAALPGRWGGVESQHGTATWCALRRLG